MFEVVYLHVACAFLSLALLLVRGLMQLSRHNWRAIKLLKILPHLSDTLLLVSGIILYLSFIAGFPLWILAKCLCLVLYIIFAAKFFSKKALQANPAFLAIAVIALSAAIVLGYYH
ncbi:invasion gene expression up-regulator SirB [Mesocricetibacter intestinalis]|uniref:Invasion gene expression up-regulator SirB n=1 Tax=Mesocricetibacter intestinalis TaxID=1521930 RepID=A0A4V3D9I9_9PAST|nr:SirB2 family protein [Mesocricetibacter intestinalis]TDQ56988.1 invasion gene expression up-regulator SirB [Mesocricetibacter intestinalis]